MAGAPGDPWFLDHDANSRVYLAPTSAEPAEGVGEGGRASRWRQGYFADGVRGPGRPGHAVDVGVSGKAASKGLSPWPAAPPAGRQHAPEPSRVAMPGCRCC